MILFKISKRMPKKTFRNILNKSKESFREMALAENRMCVARLKNCGKISVAVIAWRVIIEW